MHRQVVHEPAKAEQAVAALALNNFIAPFIPARKPRAARGEDGYEETNILSETLIGKITDQCYKVVDVAPTRAVEAADIEKAVKSGSTLTVSYLFAGHDPHAVPALGGMSKQGTAFLRIGCSGRVCILETGEDPFRRCELPPIEGREALGKQR